MPSQEEKTIDSYYGLFLPHIGVDDAVFDQVEACVHKSFFLFFNQFIFVEHNVELVSLEKECERLK